MLNGALTSAENSRRRLPRNRAITCRGCAFAECPGPRQTRASATGYRVEVAETDRRRIARLFDTDALVDPLCLRFQQPVVAPLEWIAIFLRGGKGIGLTRLS